MEGAGQLHSWTLLFLHLCLSATADLVNITAETGQNVTLSCRANNNNLVTFLEWSKHGLRKGYLLLYRDERFDLENQHSSFKNRVDLQDRQMKDGDVSLILKNVTLDDRGIYECRVETKRNRRKRANQDDDPVVIISLNVVPPEQKHITAETGQDITLPCRAPNNNIHPIVVEWSRADLDEYVLLYRDEGSVLEDQHPSFMNRVDLQDRQMKDGDVSLILKDVTTNDAGTYECHVVQGGPSLKKRLINNKPICIMDVRVVDPPGGGQEAEGKEDGSVGLIVGLSVSAVLLVAAVVGFLIYRQLHQQQDPYQPPVEMQPV
ncbi:CD226 antigen-like [Pelmatolapia mariae]|uniref:CD226 antigen-like n=1 Tax=Pelmatolapia mariae TaxID=158779 RepID=UPI003211F487